MPCDGGLLDSTSGLCWQNPPPAKGYTWKRAVSYCAALKLGAHGSGSWHLPTISELRSLIRGCPDTETGGSCGVTDSCLDPFQCWGNTMSSFGGITYTTCRGYKTVRCSDPRVRGPCREYPAKASGPGTKGAYWPAGFRGPVDIYWSSSSSTNRVAGRGPFVINFSNGDLVGPGFSEKQTFRVRCVRSNPLPW